MPKVGLASNARGSRHEAGPLPVARSHGMGGAEQAGGGVDGVDAHVEQGRAAAIVSSCDALHDNHRN
jgi:hypothetical protein